MWIVVVAVQGAALVVVAALWRRAVAREAALQRQLDGEGGRRWLPTGREAVKAVIETATLVRERGVGGAIRTSIEDLAGWAEVERPDLVRLAAVDGTLAILFSDIEGSTALNEALGDRRWLRVLGRHERMVRRCVDAHGGHVVKHQGDGFMVAFAGEAAAVECAVALQRALARRGDKDDPAIRVRIGVHAGDAVHRDGDLFGRNVAYAARVADLATGGQVLVSETVHAALEPTGEFDLGEGREVDLRGLRGTHRVHEVRWAAA